MIKKKSRKHPLVRLYVSSPLNNKFPSILFNSFFFFFVSRETTSQRNIKREKERKKAKKRRSTLFRVNASTYFHQRRTKRGSLVSKFLWWMILVKNWQRKKKNAFVDGKTINKIWNDRSKTLFFSWNSCTQRSCTRQRTLWERAPDNTLTTKRIFIGMPKRLLEFRRINIDDT